MAGFDENEAEAIASNWVQNLRFRFARMGLNYQSEPKEFEKSDDNVVLQANRSIKEVKDRSIIDKKASTGKNKAVSSDLKWQKIDVLKGDETGQPGDISVENLTSSASDQELTTTRSEKSLVNLESLREKRLNFFHDKNSRKTTFDNDTDEGRLASSPKLQKASYKSCEFQNGQCYGELKGADKLNECNKFHVPNEPAHLNGPHRYPLITSETQRSLPKTSIGCDDVVNGIVFPEKRKTESNEVPSLFPIELDDEMDDNTHHETVNGLICDSDSDSDFTLDHPISRHTSLRVEDNPIWERLLRNSQTLSSLAQSVSPPAPQITGALYHEFAYSDEELDLKPSQTVTMSYNQEGSKARQRPRSLSHPSTAWDCSERCDSPNSCCHEICNESVDVVCNVVTKNNFVDVEISYGSSDEEDSMPKGLSRHDKLIYTLKKSSNHHSLINSTIDKDPEYSKMPQNNWMEKAVKTSEHSSLLSSPNTGLNGVKRQYASIVCLECNKINHNGLNWCSECGTTLGSTKPVSSMAIDLSSKPERCEDTLPIPKTQKLAESDKADAIELSPLERESVLKPKSNLGSQNAKTVKNKPKQNGRRWEKSNLSWSTYQDNHLSKPPSTKKIKNHQKKSSVDQDNTDGFRPRSTSCKNPGKAHMKAEDGGPGSLPRSYKFREFKNRKGNSLDHGVGNLTLKGVKAKTKKITAASRVSDEKYGEINAMIRKNHEHEPPFLMYLPEEIILQIFGHLSHADLARCSCVCRQLERISQDEKLWRTIVLERKQNISDEFLEKIGAKRPVSLSLIKCHGNHVTSGGLRELFRRCADNLEELNFIGCNGGQLIGESILLHVALRCNNLRSVDASWSNVGDNGVEALVQNVERLESLCLNGCQAITDHSLKVVADKLGDSLKTFEIFGCFNVSAAAIKRLGQKCPKLETLNLGQCYKITSADIGRLVSHLESIVNLDLRGCKQARDACVKTIVKHCPKLVNLVLANCPLITDVAMSEIATNLSAVRCLDVCGCVKVTDHGVKALARSCSRLNSLDLSSTSITKKSVMLLANYCSQNLQSLKLSFCVDVTDDSVSRLVKHCKRMKILHLYGCKRLRNLNALQALNQSLKLEF